MRWISNRTAAGVCAAAGFVWPWAASAEEDAPVEVSSTEVQDVLPVTAAPSESAPPAPKPPPVSRTVGTVLPAAPSIAPGTVPPLSNDPIVIARERWLEGDSRGVIAVLTPWLESKAGPHGRVRISGHLLLGLAHMDQKNWNLASTHFYRVRRAGGPLASYGAWYEAKVDLLRGRHAVAASECRQYREKWPTGPHADECLLLVGDAYSAAGNRGAGVASYKEYLEKHPDTPRKEEIELATTLAWVQSSPKQAIPLLQELSLTHSYPSTDLAVQAALQELAARGFAVAMPTDPSTQMRRAEALRRSGQYEAAWSLFLDLAKAPDADPQLKAWADDNEERFALGTRQYDVYANVLSEQYAQAPDGELAWKIFRAWARDGRYDKAVEWGHKGLNDHPTHHRWRGAAVDMAWATLHAGLYGESADRWEALSKRGGDFGRKARFYSAFSALQAGDTETALRRFDDLLDSPGHQRARALYWRGRTRRSMGDENGAVDDLKAASEVDHSGWYTLLQQPSPPQPDPGWRSRDGRWHGVLPVSLPDWKRPQQRLVTAVGAFPKEQPVHWTAQGQSRAALTIPTERSGAWSTLSWNHLQQTARKPVVNASALSPYAEVPSSNPVLPDGYEVCRYWDPADAQKTFYQFAEAQQAIWPDLPAAHDLAIAGEYTDAARLVYAAYEEWGDVLARGPGEDPRRQKIRALNMNLQSWRPFLLFVRDHYHAARACYGLHKTADTDQERIANLKLSYPVVEPVEIWKYSQLYNVDPYLVLGIMRQESTYRNTALSPVGAIGLIQVMPRTGARIAAMLGEHTYSPGDLEDPSVNLRYGIYYLSKLLDRFDGVFPLAVASYNGGPHNVSRWYEQNAGKISLDALVEQIEYDETRDYVKKVSGHYAHYIAIYEGADAAVVVPPRPLGDDATVIDF